MAGGSDGTSFDRTVLPPPDPPFGGEIEVAFKDSKADWPEQLRVPQGAPNVLLSSLMKEAASNLLAPLPSRKSRIVG